MKFVILGPTALHAGGRRVSLGAAKQRGLLAVLLYHVREPVRVDTIVEHLWGSRTPRDCRVSLYSLASRTRAALSGVGLDNALVRLHNIGAYRLDVEPDLIDFHRFRRSVAEAREAAGRQELASSTDLLTDAINLWQGEPLADLRGPTAEHLRRHMNDSLLDAHKLLADSQLRVGGHQSVLVRLEPLLRANEFDETLAQRWIEALCAADRPDDARTYFLAFRRRFRREMRAEPAVELPPAAERTRRTRTGIRHRDTDVSGRTAVSGPRQLPKDISDFTGHDDLLTELDALANLDGKGANVIVISGMPGVGKTTLATHWGHLRRSRFPDGQLYLNANAYGPMSAVEPDDALSRFLHALDVPADQVPTSGEQRRDRLNQLLSGRRMLIVLDNVSSSSQVRPLLTSSDGCLTLITSRIRLRGLTILDGVRSVTVSPLSDQESLSLLAQIVGTARANTEPESLQALAQLSGGLPLALRIIGEHIAERPRARIADLVDELKTQLFASTAEDDDEASLRTVFAWSYNSLTPDAARLFRILGLYPGLTVSPEAAGAMSGDEPEYAVQLLNALAKAHLVNHDIARRYRFHDLLRLYAADRAAREETIEQRAEAARRLLDWYLLSAVNAADALAPQLATVPDLPCPADVRPQTFATDTLAMKWCEAERTNLSAVTRWAVKNGFHRHGWQIPGTVHEIFERYGRQDDVRELNELALSSAQLDGHLIGQIGSLNNLAAVYFGLRAYDRAAESFEACRQLAHEAGLLDLETACSHNLASVYLKLGKIDSAISIYTRVLAMCRSMSHAVGEASALHRLGDAFRHNKQYERAVGHYSKALTIREEIGAVREEGATCGQLAAVHLEMGNQALALEYAERALDIHIRTKDEAARCDALVVMTQILHRTGRRREAVENGQLAVAISEGIADQQRRSQALTVLAEALGGAPAEPDND